MRYFHFTFCLFLVVTGCSSPHTATNEDQPSVSGSTETVNNETAVSSASTEILQKLEGKYFELSVDEGALYFQEPCEYDFPFMEVSSGSDESGGYIYWGEEFYSIITVEEQNGKIVIKTDSELEGQFTFSANNNKLLWNFESERKRSPAIVRIEDVQNFEIWPCTDTGEIMKNLSTSWFELSEIDGEKVIYSPCESAPGGYVFGENGESIDFGSGSDPDAIVSMSKLDNQISISYRDQYNELETPRSMTVNLTDNKNLIYVNDTQYVSEQGKDEFPSVDEDCG